LVNVVVEATASGRGWTTVAVGPFATLVDASTRNVQRQTRDFAVVFIVDLLVLKVSRVKGTRVVWWGKVC
jgi:hypothetical protein